jgi:hypothetical protein
MVEFIASSIPQVISSILYIAAVIIVSQAVFRFIPTKPIILHKKITVFIVATLIASPFVAVYWFTAPGIFSYCINFNFMETPSCTDLPGKLLFLYQTAILFLNYLVSQFLYDKLVRKLFEKVGFTHNNSISTGEENAD